MIPLCYSSLRNRHIQVGNGSCISPWELVGDSLRVRGEISLIPYIRLYTYIYYINDMIPGHVSRIFTTP